MESHGYFENNYSTSLLTEQDSAIILLNFSYASGTWMKADVLAEIIFAF